MHVPALLATNAADRTSAGDSTRVRLLGMAFGPGAWAGSWRAAVLLLALCLVTLSPGLRALPAVDRDESRFAQASRQMLESGNWVVPMVQDRPRLNKPPLIYWLQAGSAWIFTGGDASRDAMWMYRLPGAVCSALAVVGVWFFGKRIVDPRVALLGAIMLAVCPLVVLDAHQARSDQLLLLTVVLTQGCLWMAWRTGSLRWALALWVCCGLGVLAKGPITPMIAAFTIATIVLATRDATILRRTRPLLLGVPIVLGMVLPWVAAIASQQGWSNFLRIIHEETVGRSLATREHNWLPPGFYLVVLVATFFPGSILTGAAVVDALRRGVLRPAPARWRPWAWRWTGAPAPLFLLAWTIPAWILFECVATKLVHYVMPLYPALALLTAGALLRAAGGGFAPWRTRAARAGVAIWACVGLVLTIGAPLFAFLWGNAHGVVDVAPAAFWVGLCVPAACMLAACYFAFRDRPLRTLLLSALAMIASLRLLLSGVGGVLPNSQHLWLSDRLSARAMLAGAGPERPLAAAGFREDSLVFNTRGVVQRIEDGAVPGFFAGPQRPLLIVTAPLLERLRADGALPAYDVLDQARGFNYASGRWVDALLITPQAPPQGTP